MAVALKRQLVKNWINGAIEEFRGKDLLDVPEAWLKIYDSLGEYIGSDSPADQNLLWMIDDAEDALPDIVYNLQRLKTALVKRAVHENATAELTAILAWFDRLILVMIERASGKISKERGLSEPYEAIFWAARDGMYISSTEGKFLHCNEALIKMLCFDSEEELLKLNIQEDLYLDKKQRQVMLDHLFRDGFFDHHEFHFQGADGTPKTALESCYLVHAPKGKDFIVGIMVDVTEEKATRQREASFVRGIEKQGIHAQLALMRETRRLEALLNLNDHPVILLNHTDFKLREANPAFFKRFKYSKKQLDQISLRDLFDNDTWMEIYQQLSKSMRRVHYHIRDVACVTPDVDKFQADLSIVVHNDDPGSILLVQIEDRTRFQKLKRALEQSRENLQRVVDDAPMGVIGFRGDGSVALVNQYTRDFLGYGNRKLKDISFVNQLFERDKFRLRFHKYMRQFLQGKHAENVMVELRNKAGEVLPFKLSTISFRFEEDERDGFLALMTNVSHQFQLQELLKTAKKKPSQIEREFRAQNKKMDSLQKSLETLDRDNTFLESFILQVTKKLKIPMHVVLGFSSLLKKDLAGRIDQSQKEDVRIIEDHIRIMLAMLEKAAEMVHMEAGEVTLSLKRRQVRGMLDELFSSLRPEVLPNEVGFVAQHHILSVDLAVTTDPDLLDAILQPIIENAVEFTSSGTISVSAFEENQALWIEVSDSGMGISPMDLQRVFEPFFIARREGGAEGQHLGLGLTIAKRYAELIEAQLEIQSNLNKGTAVRLRVGSLTNQ